MSTDDDYRPRRGGFLIKTLLLLLAVGVGAFGAIAISRSDLLDSKNNDDVVKAEDSAPKIDWVAAAPGRIEPKTGLVRVGAQLLGRIADVNVKLNDKVEEGELLIRLDDDEARARLQAAETEAASRKRERDAQPLDKARDDLRNAEDNVFFAERALTNARFGLEYELQAERQGNGTAAR
ncbi:MAG: biotin/lipoyl-binding protein, partial [Hyphomicrobium sp.]